MTRLASPPFQAVYYDAHDVWDVVGPSLETSNEQYSVLDDLTEQEAQVIALALNNYHAGNTKCCRARDIEKV